MNDTSAVSSTEETTTASEPELPYIVAGDWSLSVDAGSVTDFSATFTMVHTDGTGRHSHELTNFQANSGMTVQLEEDDTTTLFGTADVMNNGSPMATGVDVIITIEKMNAATITVDHEHFEGQPIYATVDSLTDENGEEMIETTTASSTSNTTSSSVGNTTSSTNSTSGNATNQTGSSTLENLGESVTDLFSGEG
jgi:hypothetical protein